MNYIDAIVNITESLIKNIRIEERVLSRRTQDMLHFLIKAQYITQDFWTKFLIKLYQIEKFCDEHVGEGL